MAYRLLSDKIVLKTPVATEMVRNGNRKRVTEEDLLITEALMHNPMVS